MQKSTIEKLRDFSTQNLVPLQASLELTNRCNERCTHCYLETFKDDQTRILDLNGWYKVLEELRSAGTLYVILMGGESMLSPHFWSVLKRSSQMGFHSSIITNGLKIDSLETAKRLKSYGLQNATISLYSVNETTHDKMTAVKGSCKRTMKAIDYLQEAGVEVIVNCLLTEANVREVFDLYDYCSKKDLELKVDPNVTAKLNGDMSPTRLRASQESLRWFYSERIRRWPASKPRASMEVENNFICNAAKGKCAVTAYGELLPCIEIRQPMGSLVKSSFSELWHSPAAEKWRVLKVGDIKNREDKSYNYCEHCPGMTLNESGKPLEISKFSQNLADIKRELAEGK